MAGDHADFNRLVFPGHDALHTVFHKLLLETTGIKMVVFIIVTY